MSAEGLLVTDLDSSNGTRAALLRGFRYDCPGHRQTGSVSRNEAEIAMDPQQLKEKLGTAAFAFRGYNVTNLGRSDELLAVPAYRPYLQKRLEEASELCTQLQGRPVDLVGRIESRREPELSDYSEAIALIVAMELGQLDVLEHCFDMRFVDGQLALGYSLGEITALIACFSTTVKASSPT